MELTPEGRAAIDKVAVGRTFTDDAQRITWMVESLHRRMSFEQETRLHRALGVTKSKPSAEEIVIAAEGQKRSLEAASTERRAFESQSRDEVLALRRELAAREHDDRLQRAREQIAAEDAAGAALAERQMAAGLGISVSELIWPVALALLEDQLDALCAAWGRPRTEETLASIERAIDSVVADMRRGSMSVADTLPSPIARAEARRRFDERGPAPGVQIISGTGGH
jgi:hypothetical protein